MLQVPALVRDWSMKRQLKVAIQGCCHGELNTIYEQVNKLKETGEKIDLLLVCGDFQAMRNEGDLRYLACPPKYRRLGDFYEYYSGKRVAPVMTLVVGGNHESSAYMWELFHGGWLAENIFYMGNSGIINFGGLRIGGISGIYKPDDAKMGHYEKQPLSSSNVHSVYHTRDFHVERLLAVKEKVDIIISHDWPSGIWDYGDLNFLLHRKPYLERDLQTNRLGSPIAMSLLQKLKPKWWFAAHHHILFRAKVSHDDEKVTNFLALDKCGRGRINLDIVEVETLSDVVEPYCLKYDPEWLTISRATNSSLIFEYKRMPFPQLEDEVLEQNRTWINENISDFTVPLNFVRTAPTQSQYIRLRNRFEKHVYLNPQTVAFTTFIGIPNKINVDGIVTLQDNDNDATATVESKNKDEIVIDDDEFL